MQLFLFRIISLVAIALVYMLFDLLNKRNVPSAFAYATLAYGFILTILYFNARLIIESIAIAAIILGIGYIFYKIGQLGAADVIEFAALSLVLPLQQLPLIASSTLQIQIPFVATLLINTGIVALIIVPIYYIPKARAKLKKPLLSYVRRKNVFMAVLLALVYVTFISFMIILTGINYIGIAIVAVMAISSFLVMLFTIPITYSMVEYVGVKQFDEGDIVALNLMDNKEINSVKKKIKDFDRLLTEKIIKQMKKEKIKEKFPVYKEAMPFALPIFIALLLSILIGNLLLFILAI